MGGERVTLMSALMHELMPDVVHHDNDSGDSEAFNSVER